MAEVRQRLGNVDAAFATEPARIDRLPGDMARTRERLGSIRA